MTPDERSVYDYYATLFAARTDAYAGFLGGHWTCVREPITAEVVRDGLAGGSLSGYTLTTDGMTHVAAIDFDTDDGLALARRMRAAMAARDVTGYVEPSRRGAHIWVVMDRQVTARTARKAMEAFLRDASIEHTAKVEIRPGSDQIKPDGFGSPLRMPTMPHPANGLRYPLLDAGDRPLPARLRDMLLAVDTSPAWAMEAMADTIRPTLRDARRGDRRPYTGPVTEGSASDILRSLWGVENARPGRSVRCPAHDDRVASLSILADDERACCKSPACALNNDDRGRGTYELTVMAPKRGA